jgi:hypothetical protein
MDTKVLQVIIDLNDIDLKGAARLPVGLRVDVFFEPIDAKKKLADTR